MMSYNMILLLFFVAALTKFFFVIKSVIASLISLEMISFLLLMIFILGFGVYSMDFYMVMVYLVMVVCEGALGLSLLVYFVRCSGNDYLGGNFKLLW